MLHSAPDAPIRGVFLSYSLRCLGCSSPWHRVLPRTIQSRGFGRAPLRPGCSNPGRPFDVFSPLPRTLQSVAPGSPQDDRVRGLGPSSTPPRMLQSGASCISLSLLSSAHQPHRARSCELALQLWGRHEGAQGGAPLAWVWSLRGRALTHPRPLVLSGVRPGPASRWPWVRCAGVGARLSLAPCPVPCSSCVVPLHGFAAPGGRCGLAPVLVPWLWPAACLSGVPRGPLLVRRSSSGPVALGAPVGSPVAVVPSPTPAAVAPGFTGWLRGARGGRPRTGLIVPAAGPCRGKGAGRCSATYRFGAPRWGCPWRVPLASVLGCVRCDGLACVDPVTDASGLPYRPSFDGSRPVHWGFFVWTPTPPLSGRRTPRPGPARVCVRALLGRVGRAGLPGAFWCALCLFGPLKAGVAPFSGCGWVLFFFSFSPSPTLLCPRSVLLCVFSGPGCLGPWRLVAPPPLFFSLPPLCAPCLLLFVFSGLGCLGPRPLVAPPLPPLFYFAPPPCCLWGFLLSGCLGPLRPPPSFFFFPSFFFLPVVRCGAGWCVLGRRVCPRVPWWCCPCRCSVCAGWCCVVLAVGPGCPVLSPGGSWCCASVVLSLSGRVARRPVVRRGVSWCSAALCCVLLRCAVVWWCAVVLCRLFASLPVPVVCFLPLRVC